jgi:flagellar biosynthesis/type III secretory pathway protein FliH
MSKKNKNICLPEIVSKRLEAVAASQNKTPDEIILDAILAYIDIEDVDNPKTLEESEYFCDSEESEEYNHGYHDGRIDGYDSGYKAGWEKAFSNVQAKVKKMFENDDFSVDE